MKTRQLLIRERATGEIVETLDVSSETPPNVKRIISGLRTQMNTIEYRIEEVRE